MAKEIDDLKAAGKHEEAGARASFLGLDRRYGCHFGMRSSLWSSIAAFYRGYDAMEAQKRLMNVGSR